VYLACYKDKRDEISGIAIKGRRCVVGESPTYLWLTRRTGTGILADRHGVYEEMGAALAGAGVSPVCRTGTDRRS